MARERSEHKRLVIVCLSLTFLSLPQVFPGYERASRNWQRGLAQVTLSLCSTCSVLSLPCSGQTDWKARCGPAAPCCGWSQCGRQEGGAACKGRTCRGGGGAWARTGIGKKVNQVCRRPGPNSLYRTERAALAPISNTPVRRASISPPSTPPMALAKRRTMSVGSPDPRFVCKVCLDHEVSASLLDCCRLYASS